MLNSETSIELEDGETQKIINADEADRPYILEVVGPNAVRIDHRQQYAADGTTLSAGQSHTISTLRGMDVYVAAHAGPSAIRVRLASADVQTQPEREVTVLEGDVQIESGSLDIQDRAGREIGKARLQDSDGTLIDPTKEATLSAILSELEDQTAILQQIETNTQS